MAGESERRDALQRLPIGENPYKSYNLRHFSYSYSIRASSYQLVLLLGSHHERLPADGDAIGDGGDRVGVVMPAADQLLRPLLNPDRRHVSLLNRHLELRVEEETEKWYLPGKRKRCEWVLSELQESSY